MGKLVGRCEELEAAKDEETITRRVVAIIEVSDRVETFHLGSMFRCFEVLWWNSVISKLESCFR